MMLWECCLLSSHTCLNKSLVKQEVFDVQKQCYSPTAPQFEAGESEPFSFVKFLCSDLIPSTPTMEVSCTLTGSALVTADADVEIEISCSSSFIDDDSYNPSSYASTTHSECLVDAAEFDRIDYILSDEAE